jgi:hypothetical protein
MGAVEVEDALAEIEEAKCGNDADDSQHGGYAQNRAHVPASGLIL